MAEEQPTDPWMKRLRWSRTGYDAQDQRINALVSLWVEGVLSVIGLSDEMDLALRPPRAGRAPRRSGAEADLETYVKSVRLAAQWMVLVRAVSFCHDEQQSTGPEKRGVLEHFSRAIGLAPAPGRTQGRGGWLQQVRRATTGLPAKDQHLAEQTELWLSGRSSNQEFRAGLLELMRELDAARELSEDAGPVQRFEFEMQSLRLDIKCMTLKTVADYCIARDWQHGDHRRQALERFEQALEPPPRRSR